MAERRKVAEKEVRETEKNRHREVLDETKAARNVGAKTLFWTRVAAFFAFLTALWALYDVIDRLHRK
jgi:hypothetical protein